MSEQGICGHTMTGIGGGLFVCTLFAGHPGWHADAEGTSWSERFAGSENDALRSRLAAAEAALGEVRRLHRPFGVYDECGHHHTEEDVAAGRAVEVAEIGWTCEDARITTICHQCCTGGTGYQSEECANDHADCYPCETVAALDAATLPTERDEPRPPDEPGNSDLEPSDEPPAPSTARTVRQSVRFNEQAWGVSVGTASDEGLRAEVERLRAQWISRGDTLADVIVENRALQRQVDAVKALCDKYGEAAFHGHRLAAWTVEADLREALGLDRAAPSTESGQCAHHWPYASPGCPGCGDAPVTDTDQGGEQQA